MLEHLHYRRRAHGVGVAGPELRWRVASTVDRVIDVVFTVIYALLGVRLVLDFILARKGSGFYELIARLSGPFYAPFKDIIASSTLVGSHPIVWSLVVAMVAYALLHGLIRAVLRVAVGRV